MNLEGPTDLTEFASETVTAGGLVTEHCDGVVVRRCSVAGVRAAVLRPSMDGYPDDVVELVSPVRLRSLFDLGDGDEVTVSAPDRVWHPDGPPIAASGLTAFDAVAFDLDGTLVDLAVDWSRVHDFLAELLGDSPVRPLDEYSRADVLLLARENGVYGALDAFLTEREGTAGATPFPLLAAIATFDCPVGICTANARSAAERVLEAHGLGGAVDAIVARRPDGAENSHPRPVTRCFERLGVAPGNGVYVGDERSDAEIAVAIGASYVHPERIRDDQ